MAGDLGALDNNVTVNDGMTVRMPAFDEMSATEKEGWPTRAAKAWTVRRLPFAFLPLVVVPLTGLLGLRWDFCSEAVGLSLDILAVVWLAQGILIGKDEANAQSTWGGIENRRLFALRDKKQGQFALVVAGVGFLGQLLAAMLGQLGM